MIDRTTTQKRGRAARALLGASCLAVATALAAAPAAEAQDRNVITYVFHESVDVYGEPLRGSTYDEHRVHLAQFEPLVYDFDGRTGERGIRPGLATSWEAIDETTWRFNLREGVTFHNGAPFNAEAVKYSIERVFRDDFPGADKFLEVPITSVEIIDDYTVDIITSEPVPIMPERLSRNGAYIVEPGHYESIDYDEALTSPMGTGPFRMVEFIPDELIRLEAYEDYWGWDEESNVDELRFKIIPELSTAVSELITGEVDMVRLPADLYNVVDENDGTRVVVQDSLVRAVVMFNLTVDECLEDARVRQALNYAVNRAEMVDAFAFGRQEFQLATMVNPPHNHPELEPYPYDPERAMALLDEAGCAGFTIPEIDVMQPQAMEHAEAVAAYWSMVGVNVGRVSQVEPAILTERWMDRALGVHAYTWSAAENTPETDMYAISDRRTRNSTHWYRDEFEDLYTELMATVDEDRRNEINYRMQEIQYEDPPGVFLYQRPIIMGVTNRIQGYTPHPAMIVEDWRGIYVDDNATN